MLEYIYIYFIKCILKVPVYNIVTLDQQALTIGHGYGWLRKTYGETSDKLTV